MKKIIIALICSIFLILPYNCLAKKITCSNNDYNATIELDKEEITLNESATLVINSETLFEAEYKINNKEILEISNDGIIKALKEGTSKIDITIKFKDEDNKNIGECKSDLSIKVLSNDSSLKLLTLEEYDLKKEFNKEKLEYIVSLPYNYEKINIVAEANNTSAKISGDGRKYLEDGENIFEVVVKSTDGNSTTYKIIVNREDANNDTSLKSLIVEGYVLTPKFTKDITSYTLNVDKEIDTVMISAAPNNEYASVFGTGKVTLASGDNLFKIKVTSQSNDELIYQLKINRNNGSSRLVNLEIENYELEEPFKEDIFTYNLTIDSKTNKLNINASASDDGNIEIIGNDNLKEGKNEIIIKVTEKDKTNTTYKLIVNKLSIDEEETSKNNTKLINILFTIFLISIIIMVILIGIFLKRNYTKVNKHTKNINIKKNKKK